MSVILMGGYLGSAILGNLLFYIGARGKKMANITTYLLAGFMIIAAILWFNSLYTTGFLLVFALVLYLIASKTSLDSELLMFLGLACILHIIQDFNVGPRSDLEKYAEIMPFIPVSVWMYLWLAVALFFTLINLRMVFSLSQENKKTY